MQACACCPCGAPVHAAAYAGFASAAAALQARRYARFTFNSDIQIDYSALLTQLQTSIAQNTFEDISVAEQIVTSLDMIRQNLANLSDEDTNRFVHLEQQYAEAAVAHLKDLYRSFIGANVKEVQNYIYKKYETFCNVHILVLSDMELPVCVILLEKMQQTLGLQLRYELEKYRNTVNNMLNEVTVHGFTPSDDFAQSIKLLDISPNSEIRLQTFMTSVNLDVRIQRMKKLLWENLLRTYESHRAIFELRQCESTIRGMQEEMRKPGFIPSDKFGNQIKSLKKGLDRERPREDNMVWQDANLQILMQKRNLWDKLHQVEKRYKACLRESKRIAAGLESEINEPGSTGPASLPHVTQVQTHANPMRAVFAPMKETAGLYYVLV